MEATDPPSGFLNMRVLIVKLTSMGDLIHALPALSDAQKAIPELHFDWVVDENFAEIPSWHATVDRVIPVAHRRWRKSILKVIKSGELYRACKAIRSRHYDVIIDAQSSYKSSIVTRMAKGLRCGMDKYSAREKGAHLFYQKHFFIKRQQHAIDRLRQLFSQALDYSYDPSQIDFGLTPKKIFSELPCSLPDRYTVFVTNASWHTKCWPEKHWRSLAAKMGQENKQIVLPWGSQKEYERALRIAKGFQHVQVLPRLSLSQIATVLHGAQAAVCVDTGLSHLTAALNIPAITLYGPTDPELIRAEGSSQQHLIPDFPCLKCYKRQCHYQKRPHPQAMCMDAISPEQVYQSMKAISEKNTSPALVLE